MLAHIWHVLPSAMQPALAAQPEASATGRFSKTPFAHLLVYAHERQLTGTFELASPGGEQATVVVREGRIAKVRTSSPVAYLGSVLYERGFIDGPTLNTTLLEVATTKRLHGELLVACGAISAEQLDLGLRDQLVRKLHHVFSLPSATEYSFYDGLDALAFHGGADGPILDPLPIVWQGLRANAPLDHVAATMTRIAGSTCLLLPAASLERFDFEYEELSSAECLRAKALGVAEFIGMPMLKPKVARLLLHFLVITKQVKISAPGPVARDSYQRLTAAGIAGVNVARPAPGPISFTMRAVSEGRPFSLSPPPETDARANLEAAEIALAKKDYVNAETFCERAHRADPENANTLALLAWIGSQRPENTGPEKTRQKVAMLDRAVRLDEECERAFLYRAWLYERLDNPAFAFRDFRKVVGLNDKNTEAMRQVRLYEMRVRNDSGPFKRFFKK